MKKDKRNRNSELQEVKIKKRSRVVRDKKKGGVRLKRWTKRRTLRVLLPVCMLAILAVGIFSLGSFGNSQKNEVDLGFVTVSYPLPEDGSTPLDHSGIENIGYMNARLKAQTKYYAEMHSAVNTIVPQTVDTFKQFSNGVLVQSDIAKSSLINDAQQFCFVGDDVIWRGASGSVSSWNGIDTPWKSGAPAGNMKVEDFKQKIGLPGTEFSVYVLREETILSAESVMDNGDGTYTQTFHLDTSPDKAPMYYMNQMIFKGGLSAPPTFDYITVTYTFDSAWQVLVCEVEEKYTATKKGIPLPATCVSTSRTEYEYGTDRAHHTAYESYFKNYVGTPVVDAPEESGLTAVECLGAAFSGVLAEPTVFSLSLDIDGVKLDGAVYVDIATMDIRARLGEIGVYYGDDGVYLSWGGVKLKTTVGELTGLIGRFLPSEGSGGSFELDTDSLLAELVKNDLVIEGNVASLAANLNLFGIELPIDFRFLIGEDSVSLGDVNTRLELGGISVGATLTFGNEEIAALTSEEKAEFIGFVPYAESLAEILGADTLGVDLAYAGEGFSVGGKINASVKDGIKAAGTVLISVGDQLLPLSFGLEENELYLNLAGIKVRAGVEELIAFVTDLMGAKGASPQLEFDLTRVLTAVFSPEFIASIAVTEEDEGLQIALKGTELLKLFGFGFDLGDVKLSLEADGFSASMLGASVRVGKGEEFVVDREGYADVLPYAKQLVDLFTGEAVAVNVDYAQGDLAVNGNLTVNLKEFAVGGTIGIAYRNISETLKLAYVKNEVYLSVGDLKLKASVGTIVNLVEGILGESLSLDLDTEELLRQIFALDFGKFISLTESDGKLNALIKGTELLQAFGMDFALGDVALRVENGKIVASVYGAHAEIAKGEKFVPENLSDYLDLAPVVPYVGTLKELFASETLHADMTYSDQDFAVRGGLDLSFVNGIRMCGSVNVAIKESTLNLGIGYENEVLYLDLAGVKVSGKVNELITLVKEFLPESEQKETRFDLGAMLTKLLSEETLSNFAVASENGVLNIAVKGTELLKAFGIDFALGDVKLTVSEGKLSANVLGIFAEIGKGESFTVEKEGYTDILSYAKQMIDLFTGEAIAVKVDYVKDSLAVHGNLTVNLKEFGVLGNVALVYGEFGKTVAVYLDEEGIFAVLDGMRMKVDSSCLGDLLALAGVDFAQSDLNDTISKVAALDFGKLIKLSEEGDALNILLSGTELLSALGMDFALGDVELGVSGGVLTAELLGIGLEVSASAPFTVRDEAYAQFADREKFADLTTIIERIPEVLQTGALAFGGEVSFASGDVNVSAVIENGAFRWKGGLKVYLDLVLDLNGLLQKISVSADSNALEFAYGQIGARVEFGGLKTLDEAFVELYDRVKSVADQAFESKSPLPDNVESILDLLKLLTKTAQTDGGESGKLELTDILNELVIGAPASENGICTVSYKGVSLELLNATDNTLCGIGLSYADQAKDIAISGGFTADVLKTNFPEMPALNYLGTADFVEMLDYIGAAVETFARRDITIEIAGTTASTADSSKLCNVTGKVLYHAGSRFPIHINTDTKDLWVNPDLYLYLDLKISPLSSANGGTYLELWAFDSDDNDELDFFVSLSRFAEGEDGRSPLRFFARAGELMTVLSDACALLGLDDGILHNYLVTKWLSVQTAEQLRAIGDMLKQSIGLEDLLSGLLSGASPASEADGQAVEYITALTAGEKEFAISLNSSAIFGGEGLNDLTVKITKERDESGKSYLTGFTLANIYGKENGEVTNVGIGLSYAELSEEEYKRPNPDDRYTAIEGIGKLFEVLANSATHRETNANEDEIFALNRYYYISGKATVKAKLLGASMLSANIDPLALSVKIEDDGSVGLNVRLAYPAVVGMIVGGCTLDISVRGDMIYLRRIQTTTMDGLTEKKLANPITTYRAMPLSSFSSDIMEQLGWMLNLSQTIKDQMTKGGDSSSSEQTVIDYGAMFEKFIKGVEWNQGANSWLLTLNGNGLTDGVIGDIFVGLNADANGYLRSLSVNTSISYGVVVDIDANLNFVNPGDEVNKTVDDVTDNISYMLESGMSKAIREAAAKNWKDENGKAIFVEGQVVRIEYMVGDTEAGVQDVLVNKATGELYADLKTPDLREYAMKGYRASWDLSDLTAPDGSHCVPTGKDTVVVYAQFTPECYKVTFLSEKPIAGFSEELIYNEQAGGLYYAVVVTYVYADGFYLANGDRWTVPEAESMGWRIAAFTDGSVEYRTQNDYLNITADTVLLAEWEMIAYTVSYEVNGVRYAQTAHYGDSFVCPVPTERAGYEFFGWQCGDALISSEMLAEKQVEASISLVASYRPVSFTVRLVSEYPIDDGWTALPQGGFGKELACVYGVKTPLDSEIRVHGLFLDGFVFDPENAEEPIHTFLPDTVFSNVTMYARWSEIRHQITFVADGVKVAVQNYEEGSLLKNLPVVPEKVGYNGKWNVPADYTVTGDATVQAVYTANSYEISVYSEYPLAGFTACEKGYVRVYTYIYDDAQTAVELPTDYKVVGNDFAGYYTMPNGLGNRFERIDNGAIGVSELYIWWKDNTVSVTLYSDVRFDGAVGTTVNGMYVYSRRMDFNDDYTLPLLPATDKYQHLGWWCQGEDGSMRFVEDVRDLNGASIWALWIQNIQVQVTLFEEKSATFNIGGVVTGGAIYGSMASRNFKGIEETLTGVYRIYSGNGKYNDKLKYGDAITIGEDGQFGNNGMTSFNALFWSAEYGGIEIKKTFTYNGVTIETESKSFVSKSTYTVTYKNPETEETIGEVSGIRAGCPYAGVDNNRYVDEVARVPVPEKRGYTGTWAHTPITSNMTVYPVYTPNMYSVVFRSAQKIEGWDFDAENNAWFIVRDMKYDSKVYLYEGTVLVNEELLPNGQSNPYTVSDGNNLVILPKYDTGRLWTKYEISEEEAKFYSYNTPDTVAFKSDVAYTVNGKERGDTYVDTFENTLTLPSKEEISAEGYVFLGWYRKSEGGWEQVTELTYSRGKAENTTVEALWQKSHSVVNSVNGNRSGFISYTNKASVSFSDCVLVGAFAQDSSVQRQVVYHYKFSAAFNKTIEVTTDTNQCECKNSGDMMNRVDVTVTTTFKLQDGTVLYEETATGYDKF